MSTLARALMILLVAAAAAPRSRILASRCAGDCSARPWAARSRRCPSRATRPAIASCPADAARR